MFVNKQITISHLFSRWRLHGGCCYPRNYILYSPPTSQIDWNYTKITIWLNFRYTLNCNFKGYIFSKYYNSCNIIIANSGKIFFTETNITFNSVNPGLVRNTDHLRRSSLQTSIYTKISVWPWMWLFMKTPNQGCQSIVYAAVEPALHNVSGAYIR